MTGYLLSIKGEASLARSGWFAIMRASFCQLQYPTWASVHTYHAVSKWRIIGYTSWLWKTAIHEYYPHNTH